MEKDIEDQENLSELNKKEIRDEVINELKAEGLLKNSEDRDNEEDLSKNQVHSSKIVKNDLSIIAFLLILIFIVSSLAIFSYLIFTTLKNRI